MKGDDDIFEGIIAIIFVIAALCGAVWLGHFIYYVIKGFL